MKTLRLTADAQCDLAEIKAYTRREFGTAQARQYLGHFRQAFHTLRAHPEIGFAIGALKPGYRCLRVQRHAIFYTERGNVIAVVTILHERQLPERALGQRSGD